MKRNAKPNPADELREVRELLKAGDPARDDPGLAPGEIARMRRTVVDASHPRGHGAWIRSWRVVAVGAALGAGVLAFVWLGAIGSPSGVSTASRITARVEPVEPEPPQPAPAIVAVPDTSVADDGLAPPVFSSAQPDSGAASEEADDIVVARGSEAGDSSAEGARARTIRFTTSNGTQIIWTIDPQLEL